MKNNLKLFISIILIYSSVTYANDFIFETSKIEFQNDGNLVIATGGKAVSADKNLEIQAMNFEYDKNLGKLNASQGIALIKTDNIKIEFNELEVNQKNLTFKAQNNVKIFDTKKKLSIETETIFFDRKINLITSSTDSILIDKNKNTLKTNFFSYELNNNIIKMKNVNLKDQENNNIKVEIAFMNTLSNKLFGKDVAIDLNNKSFNKNNQPRLKGNSIIYDSENTEIIKGVFTTCQKRDNKCPPWQLSAKKIQHNKKDQVINYKDAWLKVYDVPVLYFPKFFHPDPTVDRKSGFLIPTIKNSPNSSNYLSLPYFKVISENKDITFTPRIYAEDKIILQTEYRQVKAKSSQKSDFSIFQKKSEKSKSHFFYDYYKSFDSDYFDESDINLNIEQTSNDTYLQANKIKSPLISDYGVLENSVELSLYSEDLSIDTSMIVYEDLTKENDNDKFEYILPKVDLVKKIENKTNLNGNFLLKSSSVARNYETNIFEKTNTNDLIFNSNPTINKFGLYNNYDLIIKNVNSDAQNSKNFEEDTDHYLSSIFQFNSSLPMIKQDKNIQKILKPKLSLKISPNNTKDIRDEEVRIDTDSLFNINRISASDTIEGGASLSYGNDFSIFDKVKSREIFNLQLANNLRLEENDDLPKTNQIGGKTSNFFGEISFTPNELFSTTYNTSIKNNLKDTTYENFETQFSINNFVTTFDYINENNTEEKNSYLTNTTKYNLDDTNSLLFSTRKNKKTDLTEYYNFMYQYKNDCLAASIEYNKDFYTDRDIKPEESVFFKLTIIPFGETSSPNLKN